MSIKVEFDYDGDVFLKLNAGYKDTVEKKAIEVFIRKAKEKGIFIKNESSFESDCSYATIRLNK